MLRFTGEIWGVGTGSGHRFVIGYWRSSPFGAFTDVMVEHPDGHRQLLAPSAEIGAFVGEVYSFDEITVSPVRAQRTSDELRCDAGPLSLSATLGRRSGLGWLLRTVPRRLAVSRAWARLVSPAARLALRTVRTWGTTPGGTEYYGATDLRRVLSVSAAWDGIDLGALTDVDPPVQFGFSSTPRRPAVMTVVTTVERGVTPPVAARPGRSG